MLERTLKHRECLGCGKELPKPFLDLGSTPLANSLIPPDRAHQKEPVFPLIVTFCSACFLVQLTDLIPPHEMFSEYLYFSSYSDSFLRHAEKLSADLAARFRLGAGAKVIEVGSNDGYLLKYFRDLDMSVLGVEPAKNVAEAAEQKGIPTLNRFFEQKAVEEILEKFGESDLLVGNNVLAHVPEINSFLQAVKACLKPTGAAVFEFPYLKDLLDKTEFDTIYHEHVFYFSLSAVRNLALRSGLELFDVSHQQVHGGSLRVYLASPGAYPASSAVTTMLTREETEGLLRPECYASFGANVRALKKNLFSLLQNLKTKGNRLAAYGAPAKGNTLLNVCGIGKELLEFTVDRNLHKQGLFTPGSRLPIRPPDDLAKEKPDYTLILPWNIAEEIICQQQAYRQNGGKFVIPVPHPTVV